MDMLMPKAFIHVDMDSPKTLLKFWGLSDVPFSQESFDHFFKTAMERALSVFDDTKIKATFFCILISNSNHITLQILLFRLYE